MKRYLRVADVAEQLLVSPLTVRNYANQGLIRCERTPGGQRVFQQEDVDTFLGKRKTPTPIGYVRSSSGQKASLETQTRVIHGEYPSAPIFSDKASGLNENRKGLARALKTIQEGSADLLVVTHPDRLARFGRAYLVELVRAYGGEVVFLEEKADKSLQDELMDDFMSLLATFSGRFYRLRGWEQQKKLLHDAEARLS